MREQIKQNKKADGPLGIRTGVWLIVLGPALICVLMVSLSSRNPGQRTPDTALRSPSYQEPSTHETRSLRTDHIEFAPATREGGASYDFDEAQWAMIEQMTQDRRTWWDNKESALK